MGGLGFFVALYGVAAWVDKPSKVPFVSPLDQQFPFPTLACFVFDRALHSDRTVTELLLVWYRHCCRQL